MAQGVYNEYRIWGVYRRCVLLSGVGMPIMALQSQAWLGRYRSPGALGRLYDDDQQRLWLWDARMHVWVQGRVCMRIPDVVGALGAGRSGAHGGGPADPAHRTLIQGCHEQWGDPTGNTSGWRQACASIRAHHLCKVAVRLESPRTRYPFSEAMPAQCWNPCRTPAGGWRRKGVPPAGHDGTRRMRASLWEAQFSDLVAG